MKIIKIFLTLVFSISLMMSYGQNCANYHIDKCRWTGDSFIYSRQSKNALFVQGMTSEFSITVYGGEEYYISVKGDKNLGNIKIRILKNDSEKTVLYDNSLYKYESYFYFKNENTQNLIIEISSELKKKFSNSLNRYCLGVLIQFRNDVEKETSTGF